MLRIVSAKIPYSYSCVMAEFPISIANRIKTWCKNHIPDKDISTRGDAKGRENTIHCTVKFGLHTDKVKEISEILDGFGKFSVRLGNMSRFTSSDDFDVVKIEVEGERLRQLHELFNDLPNSDKFDEYKPHTTVAYVNKGSSYDLSGNDAFAGEEFEIDSIVFSLANGEKTILEL